MSDEQSDALNVITRLRSYRDRLTEIMDGIGDKRRISAADKAHLQRLLTSLKAHLNADVKRGSTVRGNAELTDIEIRYLDPAVRRASAGIRVKTNSHPINSKWHSELYGARIDINFFLRQLEKQYPEL